MAKYFALAEALSGAALSQPAGEKQFFFACEDVNPFVNGECFKNVEWAKNEGVKENSTNYPGPNKPETLADFQCALFLKKGHVADGPSWNCALPPCKGLSEAFSTDPVAEPCRSPETQEAPGPDKKGGPSFPWWAWLLAIAGLGLVGLAAYFLYQLYELLEVQISLARLLHGR
eukprot:TRINITY_DN76648_c0_g1_i1.p1 TRINITY_DN76648_c0_g1~~TRINITY_DN76648_c0_g1_i1.p1  ORF type:complete len:189 (+),score=32.82 TRINITY_DN76648_c0_g1_i1:49-567(+)